MMETWIYAVLPALSASGCIYLLKRLLAKGVARESIALFANLGVMNIVTVLFYLTWPFFPNDIDYVADAYLISVYFMCAHLWLFAVSLSGKPVNSMLRNALYAVPVLLTVFHLAGLMVDDYRVEHYAILHNDGVLGWSFDLFALLAAMATIATLWRNVRVHMEDKVVASRNIVALVSFVPLIAALVVVDLLSRTPYAIPVTMIGPMVILYAAVAFYYLHRERVVYLSVGIRFFMHRLKLAYALLEIGNTKSDMRGYTKAVEKQFILEALEKHQGKIQETADYLGMNHTTLRNKIKEYDVVIDHSRSVIEK
ncbi:MAG: hypothetical protein OEW58_06650 [Gammaproteobacteria bacterium]|nr:hypothetical protein [Gammaproteobacteria bacterium]